MSTIGHTSHPTAKWYFALAALVAVLLAGVVVAMRPAATSTTPPAPAPPHVVYARPFSPPAHACFAGRPGTPNSEFVRTLCLRRQP